MTAIEVLQKAKEEVARADHSIAVSLKYTRTVDVIKGIIERLIATIGFSLHAFLEHEKEQGKIKEDIPELPRPRIEFAREKYKDNEMVKDFCDFYLLLRQIDKAEYTKSQEYRRHVTMTAKLEDQTIEVTIDIITDYFNKTKEFFNYVERQILGKE